MRKSSRTHIVKWSVGALAGVGAIQAECAVRPNIVMIFTDDIGYGDIACLNPQNGFKTPAVDALAETGVRFRQAHAMALCAPSRYTILTGNQVFRGRKPDGIWDICSGSQILPGQLTLADVLQKNGYRTAFFGKWNVGARFHKRDSKGKASLLRDADLSRPMFDAALDHGFDYSLALPNGIQGSPYAFFENDRLGRWNPERNAFDFFKTDADARRVFKHKVKDGVTEDKITSFWNENYFMDNYVSEQVGPILIFKTLEFIDRQVKEDPEQPFFIHFCSNGAHYPYTPPVDLSPDDPDHYNRPGKYPIAGQTPSVRTDMVHETDVITGLIVEKLKALGVYDNTIIVYLSDNGVTQYEHGVWDDPKFFSFKWMDVSFGGNRIDHDPGREGRVVNPQGIDENGRPLKGQKGDVYEGGSRIPFVISGGANIALAESLRGKESQRLVGIQDLFATLCDLAGVTVPKGQAQDSVSFAAWLKSGDKTESAERESLLVEVARTCVPYEQMKIAEIANQHGWGLKKNKNGLIVGLTGKNVPNKNGIRNLIEKDDIGLSVYYQEPGRRWKLIVMVDRYDLTKNTTPWELYELISDPDESENLINNPEHKGRVTQMLKLLGDLLGKGNAGAEKKPQADSGEMK